MSRDKQDSSIGIGLLETNGSDGEVTTRFSSRQKNPENTFRKMQD
jgi:hypothetical protein